ncbi:MAG: alanine racemase [Acidobacteriota bacterium]|nr:alanine racemase [Acidobacteriota bacterium]
MPTRTFATRPCWVEIDTQAVEGNFRQLAQIASPHAELLAIVKADAYGHALALCAPSVVRAGAQWLGVTSVEEGALARTVCPSVRILAIAGVFPGQATAVLEHHLTPVVWDESHFVELENAARTVKAAPQSIPVHLELDTGMSRQGVSVANLPGILAHFNTASALRLEGIMTHLYAADEADGRITHEQLTQLDSALALIQSAGHTAQWLNVGNSAALLGGQAPAIGAIAARFGMKALMRPGLALYGLRPQVEGVDAIGKSLPTPPLQPVLSWKTRVVSLRTLKPGDSVGYNATFVASEPMRVALIAVGYADGLTRSLGNRFSLLVHGRRAPLIGRISMDQAVIDVTDIPDVQSGDEVVLIGNQGSERITAFDHAVATGTIPWEIFTRINARVPRVAV